MNFFDELFEDRRNAQTVDFGKCARRSLKDPYAIRRVEEASTSKQPISEDDILNLIIELNS